MFLKRKLRNPVPEGREVSESPSKADAAGEPISPEVLAKIEQEIKTRLGEKARVRSVKRLQIPSADGKPWAQQGRVLIHGSHIADRTR
jgi:hypothetical protein